MIGVNDPRPALDAPSAVEFMREALIKISEEEIGQIADQLERKHQLLRPRLEAEALQSAGAGEAGWLLRRVFATRRRADAIVNEVGASPLITALGELIHAGAPVTDRFSDFDARLAAVDAPIRRDLAGECLRFYDPDSYWLWARWMWDPRSETGALPLVLVSDYGLHAADAGVMYDRVGAGVRAVVEMADELGFHRMRAQRFAVDVYLAAIYGIYLYTVTRMRMTQEFNQVIPKLPELVRRLHGLLRLEAE